MTAIASPFDARSAEFTVVLSMLEHENIPNKTAASRACFMGAFS
jgi:hypothetical protein